MFTGRRALHDYTATVTRLDAAAYSGHVPAIQYTPTQHCCPCRLDCSIENVFELGHYTGFLIRSFEPTRAR